MSLADQLAASVARGRVAYVTIDEHLYRIESVDSMGLLRAGLAYVEGVRAAAAADPVDPQTEASIRAESATEEEAEARLKDYRTRTRERALRMHAAAVATPEGAAAYAERVHAHVMAGVTGVGMPAERAERADPAMPGVIYHGTECSDDVLSVSVVDEAQPSGPTGDAIRAHVEAGTWPLWAISPAARAILAGLVAQLAGGRADVVAPFRACA